MIKQMKFDAITDEALKHAIGLFEYYMHVIGRNYRTSKDEMTEEMAQKKLNEIEKYNEMYAALKKLKGDTIEK